MVKKKKAFHLKAYSLLPILLCVLIVLHKTDKQWVLGYETGFSDGYRCGVEDGWAKGFDEGTAYKYQLQEID